MDRETKEQIQRRLFEGNPKDKKQNALAFADHMRIHFALRATRCKRIYVWLRFASVISVYFVTILAFLNLAYEMPELKWIIPSISVIATIITTFLTITNAQKDWVRNRSAAKRFQKERFLYIQEVDEYENLEEEERTKSFSLKLMQIWDEVHEDWENTKLEK